MDDDSDPGGHAVGTDVVVDWMVTKEWLEMSLVDDRCASCCSVLRGACTSVRLSFKLLMLIDDEPDESSHDES